VQFAAPVLGLNLPGRQRLHAPFAPDEPALQEQLEIAPLPTTENDLAGHRIHSVMSSAEYLPGAQCTQLSAAALEYVPAAQVVHAAAPASGLNLPGTQRLHSPLTPDQVALQEQLEIAPLPSSEYELAGQTPHTDLLCAEYLPATQNSHGYALALTAVECFPALQSMHAFGPGDSLYLPDTHPAH